MTHRLVIAAAAAVTMVVGIGGPSWGQDAPTSAGQISSVLSQPGEVTLSFTGANLPAGTFLELGDAVIEITSEPHLGCSKFAARFGVDAAVFVNSRRGKRLNLRGVNARVVRGGGIRVGDSARKL